MWEAAAGLPEQVAEAIDRAAAADLGGLGKAAPFEQIVVCGMGGSGIAGDVLAALGAARLSVPVTVVKSYHVPVHVSPGTLVFAVSCSGNTEETCSMAEEARARGASVVTVAGPGELARVAASEGSPLVEVPTDIAQPRAAIGALAVPPLVIAERLGLFLGASELLRDALEVLVRTRDGLVVRGSRAEKIARTIGRTIPLVHGAAGASGVAAMRWKTQVNENAKAPAFFSLQPELCHNEVAGWGQSGDVTRQLITAVLLRHRGEHPQVARRFDMVRGLMDEVVSTVVEVRSDAQSDVGALFELVLVGDFVSLHLAASEDVDPGPVAVLGELKRQLADPVGV